MGLIRAIHAKCDICGYVRRDMATGTWQQGNPRQAFVLYKMRQTGWTHGKRTVCPYCHKLKTLEVPDAQQGLYRLKAHRYIKHCEEVGFQHLLARIAAEADSLEEEETGSVID